MKEGIKMKRIKKGGRVFAILLAVMFLLAACTQTPEESTGTDTVSTTSGSSSSSGTMEVEMTSVGTPRAETLVCDLNCGTVSNPGNYNFYIVNFTEDNLGISGLVGEPLWDLDDNGETVPVLAESMAEPLDDTYTKIRSEIKTRRLLVGRR